jgi:hypothetical protein
MLRFHSPLIEPDGRFSRIRLSDKDDAIPVVSRLGTRKPRDSESFFAVACNALHNAWASSSGRLSPMARPLVVACVVLELRPLCSAGVTRFRRYYGPLRHLPRPGLSLAGVQLAVTRRHRWGFLCCVGLLSQTCHRRAPPEGWSPVDRWGLSLSRFPPRRPSPKNRRVGVHVLLFRGLLGVHSRYGLLARGIALRDPFHRRLRRLRYLHRRSDCYRLERPVAGRDLDPLKTNTFPQRTAIMHFMHATTTVRLTNECGAIRSDRTWVCDVPCVYTT